MFTVASLPALLIKFTVETVASFQGYGKRVAYEYIETRPPKSRNIDIGCTSTYINLPRHPQVAIVYKVVNMKDMWLT